MDNTIDINAVDKECSALGGLFQHIINDMKGSSPVWEDFLGKTSKMHSAIKATIMATTAFLDAFQKIADLATNSKGATKEMGKSMTRLCIRHKSIENKLKSFNSLIFDGLVNPLQDKLEEWKRNVAQMDKDHAKEYKKARQEIKRSSSDSIRIQKKLKKGKYEMQNQLQSAMRDVGDKLLLLEETEKGAVRHAMIEERTHFCTFISFLKPVVDEEIAMLTEVTHLQEIVDSLCMHASDPHLLPESSEQVLTDLKSSDSQWSFQVQTPPSSPSSLGSRKSSMCSISSINSSSSGSSKSHSPSHHHRHKQQPPPGTMRLSSISSQDSGFTSQDTLFLKPLTPPPLEYKRKNVNAEDNDYGSNASTPSSPYPGPTTPVSLWADWPDLPCLQKNNEPERPHTISTAYEKSHVRPPLTSQTFEAPALDRPQTIPKNMYELQEHQFHTAPQLPRKPCVATPNRPKMMSKPGDRPPVGPKPKAKAVRTPTIPDYNQVHPDQIIPQPVYMNTQELAQMAARKHQEEFDRQDSQENDSDLPTPTATQEGHFDTALDLAAAVRELEASTAALHNLPHSSSESLNKLNQQAPTSSELADAIRELEGTTASLENSYDTNSRTSRTSLQCSSGYGTMNSTPSNSEDSVAGDFDSSFIEPEPEPEPQVDKYSTMPRSSGEASRCYTAAPSSRRPASTTDIPVVHSGVATIRRHSASKPPPPVRRSSSISTRVAPPKVPIRSNSTVGQKSEYADPQSNAQNHRRASEYATPQKISSNGRKTSENVQYQNHVSENTCKQQRTIDSNSVSEHYHATNAMNTNVPSTVNKGIANSRANFIQSLNAQFGGHSASGPQKPPSPTTKKTVQKPVINTGPQPSRNSMLSQIQSGAALKKTVCNDRSAPKIS